MTNLGTLERVASRPRAALRTLREALAIIDRIADPDGGLRYNRACAESQLLALAEQFSGDLLPADRADCLAAADRAMADLRRGSRSASATPPGSAASPTWSRSAAAPTSRPCSAIWPSRPIRSPADHL